MSELHNKNIFVSQLEQRDRFFASTSSIYDLMIVGSGISCAYTLIHYILLLKETLATKNSVTKAIKVAVLDKSAEFWTGVRYGKRSGEQSSIVTPLKEFLPQLERDRFTNWLIPNHQAVLSSLKQRSGVLDSQWLQSYQEAIEENIWDGLFIPRYLFGWYLKERVVGLLKEADEQNYLQCELIGADVCNIQKLPEAYQIETTSNVSLLA